MSLLSNIQSCALCADRFAATRTQHRPRPVLHANPSAKILIAGQAPGARVHASGLPFDDRSGDRLRDWMGIDRATFYDQTQVAIVPMAFCFPGYNASGSDLPPPKICANTWRAAVLETLPNITTTLLIGGYAQKWHLGPTTGNVTDTVAQWRSHAPHRFPLPHPSWRNTAWLKRNPWFQTDLLPVLQSTLEQALA